MTYMAKEAGYFGEIKIKMVFDEEFPIIHIFNVEKNKLKEDLFMDNIHKVEILNQNSEKIKIIFINKNLKTSHKFG